MHLVPIPTTREYLDATFPLWAPFIPDIARRSPWNVTQLLEKLATHEVQPVLVMDDKAPAALIGLQLVEDGGLVAELIWLTGRRRTEWQHLLADLESYLREHVQCVKCRPICRPGWRGFLEKHGYKQTGVANDGHVIMEKVL